MSDQKQMLGSKEQSMENGTITAILGWTTEQWAYAKQRHKLHGNNELPASVDGMFMLHQWWNSHGWPEPINVRFEGVVLEKDDAWAAKAMSAAIMAF